MDEFKDSIKRSFQACKSDIESLNEDNSYFKSKIEKLEEENKDLKSKVDELIVQVKGLTLAIDHIKDIKVKSAIEERIEVQSAPAVQPIQVPKTEPKIAKDPYEALLEFKAKANKRELLKQKMLSMISENGMNLAELKFMFVEHFRYCSKATFYNYLKELEIEKTVKVERENSKNMIYLTSVRREI